MVQQLGGREVGVMVVAGTLPTSEGSGQRPISHGPGWISSAIFFRPSLAMLGHWLQAGCRVWGQVSVLGAGMIADRALCSTALPGTGGYIFHPGIQVVQRAAFFPLKDVVLVLSEALPRLQWKSLLGRDTDGVLMGTKSTPPAVRLIWGLPQRVFFSHPHHCRVLAFCQHWLLAS